MKKKFSTVKDCEGVIHVLNAPSQDSVTLCYKTDWIGEKPEYDPPANVNCKDCIGIIKYVNKHKLKGN